MDRRSIIKQLGLAGSMAVLPSTIFIGCKSDNYTLQFLTDSEFNVVNELSDVILPDSKKSPGAKAARVANFIDSYVYHCYDDVKKLNFQKQLLGLGELSNSRFNTSFSDLSSGQIQEFISSMESERNTTFLECKQLILFGFFTSEIGTTQALRYVPVPGKFDGNVIYNQGDSAWAL